MQILLLVPVWFLLALLVPTVWKITCAYRKVRGPQPVVCPETGAGATVQLDAGHAVAMRLIGDPIQKIRSCSGWPERQGCARSCVMQFGQPA
jgi:hypothetical protein